MENCGKWAMKRKESELQAVKKGLYKKFLKTLSVLLKSEGGESWVKRARKRVGKEKDKE